MKYIRLAPLAVTLGMLVSFLPASAATGDVALIALRDFNHNGKIDRAVITFSNPSKAMWNVRSTSGLSVTYQGTSLKIADAFMASTADPAALEVVLDESDANLPIDTSGANFEVSYRRVGLSAGITDGATELAPISSGDTGSGDTELDQASPVLVSSTPVPGAIDVLRTEDLTLMFSEAMKHESLEVSSSVNSSGWLLTSIDQGRTISAQHQAYRLGTTEMFSIVGTDVAGNVLVTNGYPNPFSFRTSSEDTRRPRTENLFLITSPAQNAALIAGEATPLGWYANTPDVASIRLFYSMDTGETWNPIATVPAPQGVYIWYPPRLGGTLRLKAEARDAKDILVNIAATGPIPLSGSASIAPIRAISSVEIDQPTASTASVSVRLDRTPSSAAFSCNDGTVTASVQITGDRPARLRADLSNLAAGSVYACAFSLTDASSAPVMLAALPFTAGEDKKAPELIGPAVFSDFDPTAGTAQLAWITDEASVATVSYGAYLNNDSSAADTTPSTTHAVTLTGLVPGKLHQARITSTDAKGNAGISKDFSFVFLKESDLIKGSGPAVYWYKGGKRSAFPNLDAYRSYFGNDFSKVLHVPDTQLGTIVLGSNVRIKEGAYLVKIQSDPKTYAVEPGGKLRWIQTEAQARALYGTNWSSRVRDVDVSLFSDYAIGAPLEGSEKPAGYAG